MNWLFRYRLLVFVCLFALVGVFGFVAATLPSQIRGLATAQGDNQQWSITQLDTEFANLDAAIARQFAPETADPKQMLLRLDIALSRLNIVLTKRLTTLYFDSEEAQSLVASLKAFADRAVELAEEQDPMSQASLVELRDLTEAIRPKVRRLAVLGIEMSISRSQNNRTALERTLTATGGVAIALLVLMAALLVLLGRLVRRAVERDEALVASSRQLEATVTGSLDAIIVLDEAGLVIDFNASAERVLGWERSEILGQTVDLFLPAPLFLDPSLSNASASDLLAARSVALVAAGRLELCATRRSGERFPVELNVTSTDLPGGMRFTLYLRDIGARKSAERRLIEARDRAESTEKAKSRFLTMMSHEMRTPLNGILGVLDLLRTTDLNPQQERYVRIASASGEILLDQANEALDITRIEAGTLALACENFDFSKLVLSVTDVLDPLAREKGLVLETDISGCVGLELSGDRSRIHQILTNLVGNAIKFTEVGSIYVRVSSQMVGVQTSVSVDVQDTGPGINAKDRERIFEDFVALKPNSGRRFRGDGLGLSISRRIAREMGGDLYLMDQPQVGTCFRLVVPLAPVIVPDEVEPAKTIPPTGARGARVLVVEDNVVNRHVLRDMLMGMGHHVTEAVSGVECLKACASSAFDLILMDISMPGMDGIDATLELRKGQGPNKTAHILGLTAHGVDEFRDAATKAGMDGFETKPIRLEALRKLLGDLIEAPLDVAGETLHPLEELIAALGVERVRATGMQMWAELDVLIKHAGEAALPAHSPELIAAVHKATGAAAVLGLTDLAGALSNLTGVSAHSTDPGRPVSLAELAAARTRAKADLDRILAQHEVI